MISNIRVTDLWYSGDWLNFSSKRIKIILEQNSCLILKTQRVERIRAHSQRILGKCLHLVLDYKWKVNINQSMARLAMRSSLNSFLRSIILVQVLEISDQNKTWFWRSIRNEIANNRDDTRWKPVFGSRGRYGFRWYYVLPLDTIL